MREKDFNKGFPLCVDFFNNRDVCLAHWIFLSIAFGCMKFCHRHTGARNSRCRELTWVGYHRKPPAKGLWARPKESLAYVEANYT